MTASIPATVIEWLVEDGDPVSAGQPLVRLLPELTESAPEPAARPAAE